MRPRPLCSVCIANFNGTALIAACIDSVLAQNWGEAIEIIVHDDASTDDSVALIRARYPQVRLIESPHNAGFCIANNSMAEVACGEYLLLLNNDAALMPGALDALLAEAENIARPAILSLPQFRADDGSLLDRGCLLDPFLNPVPNLDAGRNDVGMVMGACLWIPKKLWMEIGGFPEWFGSIGEDLYLCCVARLWGYPVRCTAASGYRHHVGQSFGGGKLTANRGLSTTLRRRAYSERNKSMTLMMSYPPAWLMPMLPLHLLLLLIEGLVLSVIRLDLNLWSRIYWATFAELIRHRGSIRSSRARLQARRRLSMREWRQAFVVFPHKLKLLLRHGLPEVRY